MNRYMNTCELSEYLGINEKKIYALINEKKIPATKVTGKWIFLKELIDIWIENTVENHPQKMNQLKGILLISGSNDPLLELIINGVNKTKHNCTTFFSVTGSTKGLAALKNNKAHICVCHLLV